MAKENKDKKAGNGDGKDPIADAIALLRTVSADDKQDDKDDKKGGEKDDQAQATGDTPDETDDLDHGEKSRLGRKYKRLEKEMISFRSEVSGKLDQILDSRAAAQQEDNDPEPPLSDIPTADEIRAHGEWVLRKAERSRSSETKTEAENRKRYGREYQRLVKDYVDEDEDPELFALLTDRKDLTYNSKLSDDPKEDFLANYRNAVSHLERGKANKSANVRNKKSDVATGVNKGASNVDDKGAGKEIDMSNWSEEEKQAAKLFSPDELKKMAAEGRL